MQEYLAGFFLASLYRTNPTEFSRLLNDKVIANFKEFRYLLYFTAAQGGEAGRALMDCLCRKLNDEAFVMDVAFECHDEKSLSAVLELLRRKTEISFKWNISAAYMYAFKLLRTML